MRQTKNWFGYRSNESSSEEEQETEQENNPLTRSFVGTEPTEPTRLDYRPFDTDSSWKPKTPEPTRPRALDSDLTEPTTETASFETAPELSEPAEQLFGALLNKEKKSTLTNMTGESSNDMKVDTVDKPVKVKLNEPKPFTGKREELGKFLRDIDLQIAVNDHIYTNDIKKIAYVLSYMTEGDAESWKEEFLEEKAKAPGPLDLGTYKDFITEITKAFKPYDAEGDALEKIKAIRMGSNSAEDHVAQFKMLVTKAKLDTTSAMLIDAFRETLKIPLQRQILSMEKPPTTLTEWYEATIKLDNRYRRIQRIIGRANPDQGKNDREKKKEEEPKRRWTFAKKDPNAMDVDFLSADKRDEAMRKGLCFGCGKPGHLNRDCPDKKGKTKSYTPPPSTSKKMNAKELYTHIRSLTAQMDDEEKEKFYDEAEKEGF